MQLPGKYKENVDVSCEGHREVSGLGKYTCFYTSEYKHMYFPIHASNLPMKGLGSFPCIFQEKLNYSQSSAFWCYYHYLR
jgi:hypothetical protein